MADLSAYQTLLDKHGWSLHQWTTPNHYVYTHLKFPDQLISIGPSFDSAAGLSTRYHSWRHMHYKPLGGRSHDHMLHTFQRSSDISNGETPTRNLEVYLDTLHSKYPEGANKEQIMKGQFKDKFAPKKALDEAAKYTGRDLNLTHEDNIASLAKHGWVHDTNGMQKDDPYHAYTHPKFPEHVLYTDAGDSRDWFHNIQKNENDDDYFEIERGYNGYKTNSLSKHLDTLHNHYPEGADSVTIKKDIFKDKFTPKKPLEEAKTKRGDVFLAKFGTDKHVADHNLKKSPSLNARIALASNSKHAASMVDDPDHRVRKEIPYALYKPHSDYHHDPETLAVHQKLAKDPHPHVRRELALFGSKKIQDVLVHDPDSIVRRAIASYNSTDQHHQILKNDPDPDVRRAVAAAASPKIRGQLLDDKSQKVKLQLHRSARRTPTNIALRISGSDDPDIARWGQFVLKKQKKVLDEEWKHGSGGNRSTHAQILADHGWIKNDDYISTSSLRLDNYTHPKFPGQYMTVGDRWSHSHRIGRGGIISSWIDKHPEPNHLNDYLDHLHAKYPDGVSASGILRDQFINKYQVKKFINKYQVKTIKEHLNEHWKITPNGPVVVYKHSEDPESHSKIPVTLHDRLIHHQWRASNRRAHSSEEIDFKHPKFPGHVINLIGGGQGDPTSNRWSHYDNNVSYSSNLTNDQLQDHLDQFHTNFPNGLTKQQSNKTFKQVSNMAIDKFKNAIDRHGWKHVATNEFEHPKFPGHRLHIHSETLEPEFGHSVTGKNGSNKQTYWEPIAGVDDYVNNLHANYPNGMKPAARAEYHKDFVKKRFLKRFGTSKHRDSHEDI